MRKKPMTIKDLEIAVAFLRRLSVGQLEADDLIRTVEALEAEITKRRAKKMSDDQRAELQHWH
jgi:hypothetical protein